MNPATVSVIIPCAGMANFLTDAVDSVLRQDHPIHEILIVHPAGDVETALVGQQYVRRGAPVVLLEGPESGPGPVRNVGLAHATGEVIAFLDADDLWPAGKVSMQLDRLAMEPQVDAVGGLAVHFEFLDKCELKPTADPGNVVGVSSVLGMMIFRRTIFDKIGGFDEDFLYAEDIDLFLRMRDFGVSSTILDATTLYYRRHGNSMMLADNPRKRTDLMLATMKSVRRRRQIGLPPADKQMLTGDLESWPRDRP